MFDKKNVTISDSMKVNLFTNCSQDRFCGLKGGIPYASEEKSCQKVGEKSACQEKNGEQEKTGR